MKVKVWGARGSVPAPGPEMNRYGGNTSCVELELSDGSTLIIDAGTGIRSLGVGIAKRLPKINILLTHLHLDHIQGLMFFAPCFRSESEITIWGPSSPEASLEERIARYISAALPRRGPRAALRCELPGYARHRMGTGSSQDPRRGRHPSWPDARLPHHRRSDHPDLHLRSRTGARSAARVARTGVDLGL